MKHFPIETIWSKEHPSGLISTFDAQDAGSVINGTLSRNRSGLPIDDADFKTWFLKVLSCFDNDPRVLMVGVKGGKQFPQTLAERRSWIEDWKRQSQVIK